MSEWMKKKPTPFFYERWIILHSIVPKSKIANKIWTCTILASIPLVLCLVVIGAAKLIFFNEKLLIEKHLDIRLIWNC